MVDPNTQEQTPSVEELEEKLNELLSQRFLSLDDSEEARLSKVLFPLTHSDTFKVLGIERTLHPTSLKISKVLQNELLPFSKKHDIVTENPKAVEDGDFQEEVIKAITIASKILADSYGWEDVSQAIDGEEISLGELQGVCVTQMQLNGVNDFLLAPLRTLIKLMQIYEVTSLKFQSLYSTRPSRQSGTAL